MLVDDKPVEDKPLIDERKDIAASVLVRMLSPLAQSRNAVSW